MCTSSASWISWVTITWSTLSLSLRKTGSSWSSWMTWPPFDEAPMESNPFFKLNFKHAYCGRSVNDYCWFSLMYTTTLTTWIILSISLLTVTELQNLKVTCTHQYIHTQAVYKTTKMKYINYMYACTLFLCKQLNDPRHRMTCSEIDIFLTQWKMLHIPPILIISLYIVYGLVMYFVDLTFFLFVCCL